MHCCSHLINHNTYSKPGYTVFTTKDTPVPLVNGWGGGVPYTQSTVNTFLRKHITRVHHSMQYHNTISNAWSNGTQQ